MSILPNPDCQLSAHDTCPGTAWDTAGQEQVTCPCPCHEGTPLADIDPATEWMTPSDLVRNWTIAANELREVTDQRNRGTATAAELAHARSRVAGTRKATEERTGLPTEALFGTEVAR